MLTPRLHIYFLSIWCDTLIYVYIYYIFCKFTHWSGSLEVALARLALEYDLQTCPSQSSPWVFGSFQLGQTAKHGE